MSRVLWFVIGGLSVIGASVAAVLWEDRSLTTDSTGDDETSETDDDDTHDVEQITTHPPADTDNQEVGGTNNG